MRCNLEWLKQWLPIETDAETLGEHLTMAGLELEAVESVCHAMSGVVVGRVVSLVKHPDSDKLKLCKVDVGGKELHDVVCGADNVRAELLAAYAPSAARIGDSLISVKNIRGCHSDGMLCSAYELGMAEEQTGLLELDSDAEIGQSLIDYLKLDDLVYDIDLTPNRADCLSVLGIARELSAIGDLSVNHPQRHTVATVARDAPEVQLLQPDACPRYSAKAVYGLDILKTTPLWMKERLRRCGIRAVYPVVDILNYVMLELGQPMHAFDKTAIKGALRIRWSNAGEELKVLGGQSITLDNKTLVIADELQAVAIAGIIGGEHSAVKQNSSEIILESAFFKPEAVLGRARQYGLQTESSHRFERGVDFELPSVAIEYASYLITELLGGEAGPTVEAKDSYHLPTREPIDLNKDSVAAHLGVEIDAAFIKKTLTRLGCELETKNTGWRCTPPSYRFDLTIEADLIEEIARIYGYDRIPETVGSHTDRFAVDRTNQHLCYRSDYLTAQGYFEVITYSFINCEQLLAFTPDADIEALRLENPVSVDMSVMRTSLWPGLLQVLRYNLNRQQDRVCIFEQGAKFYVRNRKIEQKKVLAGLVYGTVMPNQWNAKARHYDFYDVKGDIENMLQAFENRLIFKTSDSAGLHSGLCADIYIKDKRIGRIGALSPSLAELYKLHAPVFLFELDTESIDDIKLPRYQAVSAYPFVRRDIAFVVPEAIEATQMLGYIDSLHIRHLIDRFIFDVFADEQLGKDVKNIGVGFIFQDTEQTLSKDTVDDLIQTLITEITREFNAELRL